MVRGETNKNSTGHRIRRRFFDTQFAPECNLDNRRQPPIAS
jgi:hypothetical protein